MAVACVLLLLLLKLFLSVSFPPMINQSPKSVVAGDIFGAASSGEKSTSSAAMSFVSNDGNAASGMDHPRSLVFELTALVGELAAAVLRDFPLDPPPNNDAEEPSLEESKATTSTINDLVEFTISKPNDVSATVSRPMGKIVLKLFELSHSVSLNLGEAIVRKMELNNKKYPMELCRGKAGKYTQYSDVTGITKENGQSTLGISEDSDEPETLSSFLQSLDSLTEKIGNFAMERQWARYHTPRNITLALIGELGEVSHRICCTAT
jgi:hypothetical protein